MDDSCRLLGSSCRNVAVAASHCACRSGARESSISSSARSSSSWATWVEPPPAPSVGANQPGLGGTPARGCSAGSQPVRASRPSSPPRARLISRSSASMPRRAKRPGRSGTRSCTRGDLRQAEVVCVERRGDDAEAGHQPVEVYLLTVGAVQKPFEIRARPDRPTPLAALDQPRAPEEQPLLGAAETKALRAAFAQAPELQPGRNHRFPYLPCV